MLLSAAAVALLRHHPLLADRLTTLGYIPRLLALLAARTPAAPAAHVAQDGDGSASAAAGAEPAAAAATAGPAAEESGALLRLLHQLCASSAASESLAAAAPPHPAIPVLLGATRGGHAATLLVLETLKRALGPSNRNRDMLVAQALQVGLGLKDVGCHGGQR